MQTQTSNALHNAIMEAGGKDRPPMLTPGNYNPYCKFKWTEKTALVAEGSSKTTTEGYMENYNNVSQDIRDQLDVEAKVVQIILTGIDNDIYSTVDACLNACEMWKAIERLKQVSHPHNYPTHYTQNSSTKSQQATTKNRGKAIVNSFSPTYDQETIMVTEDDEMSKDKEIDKLMALNSLSFKKIYKPTNNNLRTLSNTIRANQDNSLRINRETGYDNQRIANVAATRENVDTADNFGPIFDAEPLHKVHNNDDHYNVLANNNEHAVQPEFVNATYMEEQVECERLEKELSKSKTISKNFEALQKHAINLELALQQCKEQIKNDKVFQENQSKGFLKEREKYFEIQELKSQLQDKGIAISELKKLIDKMKEKSVETKFEKSSVIHQPNTFKSQRKSILGTVKFRNDQISPILGYGDLVQGTITMKRVYYVEGLNHNLFPVGQLCDTDLEVAFRKSTCYIRDLKGNNLLTGSRGPDLYSITHQDTSTPNPIYLMAKATSSQAWLWHRRLLHLNFDSINFLTKNNIVNGLPKIKFVKDHLCSSCELGKAKQKSFHTKTTSSSKDGYNFYTLTYVVPCEYKVLMTKDHPLEQVIGNPSQSIRTRRQLETDGEMCIFALTVSRTEPKNIKEAIADSAWIKAVQEEVHQFDRLVAAIAISCNPVQHSHTKHINVRYPIIKEQVEKGIVELFFVRTKYKLADLFTKALLEDRFKYLVRRLGMRCLTPEELENENKGIMPTKIELTLEQLQQGVSNDVLVAVSSSLRVLKPKAEVDQESQIKMIQVKEMMQDKDLKNSDSKEKGLRSRPRSMNEQSHYKQEKTKTRPRKAKLKCHIFNIREDKVKSR
nr:integrase, catalytic region, zinc finger, CCHC-type, peptidase aspartic, catalytic [Tanacetum cinerariifolium]